MQYFPFCLALFLPLFPSVFPWFFKGLSSPQVVVPTLATAGTSGWWLWGRRWYGEVVHSGLTPKNLEKRKNYRVVVAPRTGFPNRYLRFINLQMGHGVFVRFCEFGAFRGLLLELNGFTSTCGGRLHHLPSSHACQCNSAGPKLPVLS